MFNLRNEFAIHAFCAVVIVVVMTGSGECASHSAVSTVAKDTTFLASWHRKNVVFLLSKIDELINTAKNCGRTV